MNIRKNLLLSALLLFGSVQKSNGDTAGDVIRIFWPLIPFAIAVIHDKYWNTTAKDFDALLEKTKKDTNTDDYTIKKLDEYDMRIRSIEEPHTRHKIKDRVLKCVKNSQSLNASFLEDCINTEINALESDPDNS
jgi:hypothetical protein